VAYVPGSAFYAPQPGHDGSFGADARTLRLSFVTLSPEDIANGVALLGGVLREHLAGQGEPTP
jgi:2-aminoadipate transaminase